MANCAPARLWMWVEAQRPKAAEPPALFISATRMPSMTRKARMPTLPESDSLVIMTPSSLKNRVFSASSRLPLAYSSAPEAMPTNSEVYTSLVFSASTMAMTGGSREKKVLYTAQV